MRYTLEYKPMNYKLVKVIDNLTYKELQLVIKEMRLAGYFTPTVSCKQPKNYMKNLLKLKLKENPENSHGTFEAWLTHILKTYIVYSES